MIGLALIISTIGGVILAILPETNENEINLNITIQKCYSGEEKTDIYFQEQKERKAMFKGLFPCDKYIYKKANIKGIDAEYLIEIKEIEII